MTCPICNHKTSKPIIEYRYPKMSKRISIGDIDNDALVGYINVAIGILSLDLAKTHSYGEAIEIYADKFGVCSTIYSNLEKRMYKDHQTSPADNAIVHLFFDLFLGYKTKCPGCVNKARNMLYKKGKYFESKDEIEVVASNFMLERLKNEIKVNEKSERTSNFLGSSQ